MVYQCNSCNAAWGHEDSNCPECGSLEFENTTDCDPCLKCDDEINCGKEEFVCDRKNNWSYWNILTN